MADRLEFDPVTKQLYGMGADKQFFGMLFHADGPDPVSRAKVAIDMHAAFKRAEEKHRLKIKEPQAFGPYFENGIGWYYAAYAEVWYWQPDWRGSDGAKVIMQ